MYSSMRTSKALSHTLNISNCTLHGSVVGLMFALCLLLACNSALAGDVYRWTDANGTVHFGEHPPQGVKASRLSTSTGKRSTRGASPKAEEEAEAASSGAPTAEAEQPEAQPTVAAKPPKPKKNKEICERARYNYTTLSERARIRQKDENGEESYMTEEQKKEQKKAAKKAIDDYC